MSSRDAIAIVFLHYLLFNKGSSHEIVMKFNWYLTLLSCFLVRYFVHDELRASQLSENENYIPELSFSLLSKTIGKRKLD